MTAGNDTSRAETRKSPFPSPPVRTSHDDAWECFTAFATLCAAARRAARGKRDRCVVAKFLDRREPEILALQRELLAGNWRPGPPFVFVINDPKRRTISAAPFRDRVVHHALIHVLEDKFERRMVYESFACRRGKGTYRAVRHAQRELRRHPWFLKLDILHCFETLDHDVVLEVAYSVVRDSRLRSLLNALVRESGQGECGLPIGALTSQWLANLVLDRIDHFVKEDLRIPGYVRYMDDFVLFASDRTTLRVAHEEVRRFIEGSLKLKLKDRVTQLAPARQGLPFLGWRIYRGGLRLRPDNLRRTRRRIRARAQELREGCITERQYADAVRSAMNHMEMGNTRHLRRDWFRGRFAAMDGGQGS